MGNVGTRMCGIKKYNIRGSSCKKTLNSNQIVYLSNVDEIKSFLGEKIKVLPTEQTDIPLQTLICSSL